MSFAKHFPATTWVFRTLTGRWARRVYLASLLILICLPIWTRFRTAYLALKFHAVLAGLEQVKVDQTSEAELVKLVPYLKRRPSYRFKSGSIETWYGVEFSNEYDRPAVWVNRFLFKVEQQDYQRAISAARVLGTWFLSFAAGVMVRDGKVALVTYGINSWGGYPRSIGQTVWVRSGHGEWLPYRHDFRVPSHDDQNLRFRIERGPGFREEGSGMQVMRVHWAPDAPPELISHLYRVDLSCAWSLHGCIDAQQIAPLLWQDGERIETAMRRRLAGSEPCPDSILADRIRYLPDIDVLLLEVAGSQPKDGKSKGEISREDGTFYQVLEGVRGENHYPARLRLESRPNAAWSGWELMQGVIVQANPRPPHQQAGDRALFFAKPAFESCQLVSATPSALRAVRGAPAAPKLHEDEIPMWIQ